MVLTLNHTYKRHMCVASYKEEPNPMILLCYKQAFALFLINFI